MRLKKILLSVLLVLFAVALVAQKNSWDGWRMKPRGEIRMLNFFVNIIYDVNPEREKPFARVHHWNTVMLESINQNPPDYLLRLMDTVYNAILRKLLSVSSTSRAVYKPCTGTMIFRIMM